jgi:alpha-L-rhamnosidase
MITLNFKRNDRGRDLLFLLVAGICLILSSSCKGDVQIVNMKCEYIDTPILIDINNPRLEWQYGKRAKFFQKSFVVEVATDEKLLRSGKADVWNSGVVESPYPFVRMRDNVPLMFLTRFYWRVTARDSSGRKVVSPVSYFQTDKMRGESWRAMWITDSLSKDYPSPPVFRREFVVSKKHYAATLSISGVGSYEFYINGKKVEYDFYSPAVTDYSKRVLYNTYDITDYIVQGPNVIYVETANGCWQDRPMILCGLVLYYQDGTKEQIVTDEHWKTSSMMEYLRNDFSHGMVYDASSGKEKCRLPGFDDSGWSNSVEFDMPGIKIQSQIMPPMRMAGMYSPSLVTPLSTTRNNFFFSGNIFGFCELDVNASEKTKIIMRYGLDTDDKGYVIPIVVDTVFVSGSDSAQEINLSMSFHSFKCIDVETDKPLDKIVIKAFDVRSDIRTIGSARCSNTNLNDKCISAEFSFFNTMFSYLVPKRLVALEGNHNSLYYAMLTSGFGMFDFDAILLYEKFIQDVIDTQGPDGSICTVAPDPFGCGEKADAVYGSALLMIPYKIFMYTADSKCIEMSYLAQKRFMAYLESMTGHDGLLGKDFFEDCFYYYDNKLLYKNTGFIGKDVAACVRKDSLLFKAINDKWFDVKDKSYDNGSLYSTAMAYSLGLVPAEYQSAVEDRIRNLSYLPLGKTDRNLSPAEDELGRRYLLMALTTMKDYNNAFGLLFGDKCPSSYDVNNWMSGVVAGLQIDSQKPGYQHFIIDPYYAPDMSYCGSWHTSPNGIIRSSWKRNEDGSIFLMFDIPGNTTATVTTDHTENYGPGLYKVTFKVSE